MHSTASNSRVAAASVVFKLDHALTGFETHVSPWKEPLKWIEADTGDINSIIRRAIKSLKNTEIEQTNFSGQVMVHAVSATSIQALGSTTLHDPPQRLIIYVFIHLARDTKNTRYFPPTIHLRA
jgi:hypothetical protein